MLCVRGVFAHFDCHTHTHTHTHMRTHTHTVGYRWCIPCVWGVSTDFDGINWDNPADVSH